MQFVTPGVEIEADSIKIGPGILYKNNQLIACKAGYLVRDEGKAYINSAQKRYCPNLNEPVVGVIIQKQPEVYKVDIGCAIPATLNHLAFEGVVRRNKPSLEVGAVVYARVINAHKDMDPEIECMNDQGKAVGYGELKGGFVIKTSLELARRLMLFLF